jgi:hypothetical protein
LRLGVTATSRLSQAGWKSLIWAEVATVPLVLFAIALSCLACGGGGPSASAPPPPNPGTPAGTYTVTVTGNFGQLSKSTTVTLTVK